MRRSKNEDVVFLSKLLELEAGLGCYGTKRDLHPLFNKVSIAGGNKVSLVLVVIHLKRELNSVKTARSIDLTYSELCAVINCCAIYCCATGKGAGNTNLNGVIREGRNL